MSTPNSAIPPEVLQFLAEPPPEARQFDFLLGEWRADATRFQPDGTPLVRYQALWTATALHGGRMIMDDFQALGPTGQPVSSFVTLRTYCAATRRWELAGLQALQPAAISQWHGTAEGAEMVLQATARTPAGAAVLTRIRFFDIAQDTFAWESHASLDGGEHWQKTAALTATRVRPGD